MGSYNVMLLVIAAVNAAVAVYYYLHVIVNMYFKDSSTPKTPGQQLAGTYKVVLCIAVLLTLAFGIYPDFIIGLL